MKQQKQIFVLLIFSIVSFINISVFAQTQSQLKIPEHPRLLFTNEDLQNYQHELKNDPFLKSLHNTIIKSCDELLDLEPLEYNKKGKRLLGVSRTYLKRIFYLSYAYRLTGEMSYAEKAEEEMISASGFVNWNPSHFLDVAEMTMALAIGYDWIFDELKVESRERIKSAILQYGLIASQIEGNNWWLRRKHNWNQVCNAGITYGALAIYEDIPQLAEELINSSLESITLAQNDYEPDGAYAEGPSYWGYGTSFNVLFLEAVQKIPIFESKVEINPGLLKTGEYFLHIFGPTGSFNYFDNGSSFSLTPAIFWFAKTMNDPSLVYHQIPMLEELKTLKSEGNGNRLFPMVPIWLSKLEDRTQKTAKELSWTGHGPNPVSFHRTSWDKDAIFIGVKGGRPGLNHGHMDAGSFVMDAFGIRWVQDLGGHPYYELEKEGFDLWNRNQDSERWKLFRYSNFAHSTLVINNSTQLVDGNCPIINAFDEKNRRGAVVDLSEVYKNDLKSSIRTVTIKDQKIVSVIDNIENGDSLSKVRWGILTYDSINKLEKHEAIIEKDNKYLKIILRQPSSAKFEIFSTKPNYSFERDNPGTAIVGFEIELLPDEKAELVVDLIPYEKL